LEKKLFNRLVESMQQHTEIARGKRAATRQTFVHYDAADYLKTKRDAAAYLAACIDEGQSDPGYIAAALRSVIRARGAKRLAEETGIAVTKLRQAASSSAYSADVGH
jgi:probable addiction module antidote protein